MTYRKIGGLHHFRLWRFGVSWYWAKPRPKAKRKAPLVYLEGML